MSAFARFRGRLLAATTWTTTNNNTGLENEKRARFRGQ
jgi:hypothetical protein